MKLIIEDDEGRKTVVPMVREEITIGRQEGNTIRLTERNVSRRHARLVKDNGSILIEDLGSYNGVRVNGEKIAGPTKIKEGDLVEIGDYDLGIQGKLDEKPATSPGVSAPRQATVPPGTMKAPAAARPVSIPPQPAPPPQAAATAQESIPTAPAQPPLQSSTPSASAGGATAIIRVSDIMKQAPQVEARDLQRTEMPRLVGLAGPQRGKEYYLMRSEVKFGRTDENDISIDHQSVSRQHAKFVLDQGQWKVIDNKSANGVRVNGEDYAVSNLKPGDTIELGHLKFRFCGPGEKFTPPPDTSGEQAAVKGGMKPTTAELIAGASQPGRGIPGQAKAAAKAGPPMALIGGIVGAVVVIGIIAFLVIGRGKKTEEGGEAGEGVSGAAALKAGDAAFKKHDYIKANELYEKAEASGEKVPNKKRAAEEAKAEEQYNAMKGAVDSGDGDKAKNIYEKCASESTFYCQKAQEMADPVKASYAKKHLGIANAAKTAGKNEVAQTEVNNVLAFDPNNAEAQALLAQLSPQETKEPPPKKEGPSPREREAKAAKLVKEARDNLVARDFQTAVKLTQQALAQNPGDKATLATAYYNLGYAYANLGDRASAKKWLRQFRPLCTASCDQVDAYLNAP
ncbi:MAG: FHA domain-containing protein [Myxococcales bacterium]